MRRLLLLAAVLAWGACERPGPSPGPEPAPTGGLAREDAPTDTGGVPDTAPEAGPEADNDTTGAAAADTAASDTTAGAADRPASRSSPPAPPEGYAIESFPAAEGRLARIDYATPKPFADIVAFYDGRIGEGRRVEAEADGRPLVVYRLSDTGGLEDLATATDIEALADRRIVPLVVVAPWRMMPTDPLIRELREAGLEAQAREILETRTRVTVVYGAR